MEATRRGELGALTSCLAPAGHPWGSSGYRRGVHLAEEKRRGWRPDMRDGPGPGGASNQEDRQGDWEHCERGAQGTSKAGGEAGSPQAGRAWASPSAQGRPVRGGWASGPAGGGVGSRCALSGPHWTRPRPLEYKGSRPAVTACRAVTHTPGTRTPAHTTGHMAALSERGVAGHHWPPFPARRQERLPGSHAGSGSGGTRATAGREELLGDAGRGAQRSLWRGGHGQWPTAWPQLLQPHSGTAPCLSAGAGLKLGSGSPFKGDLGHMEPEALPGQDGAISVRWGCPPHGCHPSQAS